MSQRQRSVTDNPFLESSDFNEQLYHALKKSPWWAISLAVHGLLFAISSMIAPDEAAAAASKDTVQIASEKQEPIDVEKTPDPIERLSPPDDTRIPVDTDKVVESDTDEPPQTDNNMDADELYGHQKDALASGDFDGISTNKAIGLGGGLSMGGFGMGGRKNAGRRGPGTRPDRAQESVDDALRWLAAHQSPDGAWEAEGFTHWFDGRRIENGPDGLGKAQYDVGVTGLAVLAFLGAGQTHMSDGPYGDTVRRGLRWLRSAQDAEGCVGPRSSGHFVYNHSIAALALVEAYAMTGSTMMRIPARKAIDFIALARNPYFAWRYGVKPGDNDTSVTGWMMMALKSARLVNEGDAARGRPASFDLDLEAFDGIRSWIDKMTDPETGRVGYQQRGSGPARPADLVDRFPADRSEAMTAVGVLARVFLGENPKSSAMVQAGARLCSRLVPEWSPAAGTVDMYYWYYATLAMFQVGGDSWKAWDAAMKPAIVDSQRRDGDYAMYRGSWDPVDPWGNDGGRVYATATMAMCLEVYYRYDRVFGTTK